MAKKLTRLRVDEISSVDKGAGEGVKVMLIKRETKKMAQKFRDIFAGLGLAKKNETIKEATKALATSVVEILKDEDGNKEKQLSKTFKQFDKHLEDKLSEPKQVVEKKETTPKEESKMDLVQLKKAFGLPETATEEELTVKIAEKAARKEAKAVEEAAKAEEIAKQEAVKKEETILKIMKENDELKKAVGALVEERALAEFTKKAVDLGLADTEGATLKKAYGGDREAMDKIVGFLKAANAQLEESTVFFKELGDGRQGLASDSPYSLIKAKADELKKSDPSLTDAQAFAKVYEDPANAAIVSRERQINRPRAVA